MGIFFRSDTIFVPFLVHRAPKRKRGVVGAAPYSSIELLVKLPIYGSLGHQGVHPGDIPFDRRPTPEGVGWLGK